MRIGNRLINARSKTLLSKPSFRSAATVGERSSQLTVVTSGRRSTGARCPTSSTAPTRH
jgi:hypothetical protein